MKQFGCLICNHIHSYDKSRSAELENNAIKLVEQNKRQI